MGKCTPHKCRGQGSYPMCHKPGSGADLMWCIIHLGAFFACGVMSWLNHLQYTIMVANHQCDHYQAPDVWQIFYGRLVSIWDLVLPASHTFHLTQPTQFLLALVMPCSTRGKDVTKEITTARRCQLSLIFELWNVSWGMWSVGFQSPRPGLEVGRIGMAGLAMKRSLINKRRVGSSGINRRR